MRLMDRMMEEQKRVNRQAKKSALIQQDPDEDDMGMAYRDRPRAVFLNDYRGVFANEDTTSINTAPSVFERTALFHAGGSDQEGLQ